MLLLLLLLGSSIADDIPLGGNVSVSGAMAGTAITYRVLVYAPSTASMVYILVPHGSAICYAAACRAGDSSSGTCNTAPNATAHSGIVTVARAWEVTAAACGVAGGGGLPCALYVTVVAGASGTAYTLCTVPLGAQYAVPMTPGVDVIALLTMQATQWYSVAVGTRGWASLSGATYSVVLTPFGAGVDTDLYVAAQDGGAPLSSDSCPYRSANNVGIVDSVTVSGADKLYRYVSAPRLLACVCARAA